MALRFLCGAYIRYLYLFKSRLKICGSHVEIHVHAESTVDEKAEVMGGGKAPSVSDKFS